MPNLVPPAIPIERMASMEQPVLGTVDGGLILRPWRPADADALIAAFDDPAIQRWHTRRLDSSDEALGWVAQWEPRWRAGTDAGWAVTDATSGEVLGQVGLRHVDLDEGLAEMSYWVLPGARGQRVAPRAAATVGDWSLQRLGLHRIEIRHSVLNVASCRVAMSADFPLECTLRSQMLHTDGWHDTHVHTRIAGSS